MPMSRRFFASPRFVVTAVLAVVLVLIIGLQQATPASAQTTSASATAGRTTAASATAPRPVATGVGGAVVTAAPLAATATRPAATAVPASMPRAGGGGLAKSYVDSDNGVSRGLWLGIMGALAVVAVGGWYALRLRRR